MAIAQNIEEAIQDSRKILDWPDDWDGEGSKTFGESTWSRAVNWLREATVALHKRHELWVDPPQILPASEGSIDIYWKTSKSELLINFPENPEESVEYYGCGNQKDTVRGKLDVSQSGEWLLAWLMQ